MGKVKAIGYCRVAVNKQSGKNKAIEVQKQQIEEVAKSMGVEIFKWFVQEGYEPVTFLHDTLGKALKYCKTNPNIEYLIISSVDRLSRSIDDYIFWKTAFRRAGVNIVSRTSGELDSPMATFVERLGVLIEQIDHEHRAEMIKRGIQAKKAREA